MTNKHSTKMATKKEMMRQGQFVLRTMETPGNPARYVNRQLVCADPNDYLSIYVGYAVVYSSLDSKADKIRFWSTILKQPVEAMDVPMINGLAVGDTVRFEDLEQSAVRSGKISYIDPFRQDISVVVGKSMRVLLHNERTNGRFFCPALKADAEQAAKSNLSKIEEVDLSNF